MVPISSISSLRPRTMTCKRVQHLQRPVCQQMPHAGHNAAVIRQLPSPPPQRVLAVQWGALWQLTWHPLMADPNYIHPQWDCSQQLKTAARFSLCMETSLLLLCTKHVETCPKAVEPGLQKRARKRWATHQRMGIRMARALSRLLFQLQRMPCIHVQCRPSALCPDLGHPRYQGGMAVTEVPVQQLPASFVTLIATWHAGVLPRPRWRPSNSTHKVQPLLLSYDTWHGTMST
jgi:hypothetical protein